MNPNDFEPQHNGAPPPPYPGEEEIDLREVLHVLLRRWWMVAGAAFLVVVLAFAYESSQPDRYTAGALLRKEARTSPLDALSTGLISAVPDAEVGSQIEVLRSNAVLRPVVDSIGLRLSVASSVPRGELFEQVVVSPQARPGEYLLVLYGNGAARLESEESGRPVARASAGEWLEGDGLRMLLSEDLPADEEIPLEIHHHEAAVDRLRDRLSIEQVRGTSLIRLRYTATDPELAAEIVATVGQVYQDHAARQARQEARRRREFIAGQLASVADSLRAAQALQLEYQERSGTVNPEVEGEALIASALAAEQELRTLRYQEAILTTLVRSLANEGEADDALRRTVALGRDVVPGAESLYARLQQLQDERSRLSGRYTSEVSQVQVVDSLIADTKREMREMSSQSLRVVQARKDAAEQRVAELEGQVRTLPGRSTGYLRLKQRADAVQATYDLLAEKYYEAQIAEAVEGGDVEIVDPPIVPVLPDERDVGRNLVLALMLGLMVGVGGAFTMEYFDRGVRGAEDAEAASGAPVLAAVPRFPGLNGTRALVAADERSSRAEAFRSLHTMLRFSRTKRPKVLAITSAGPAEGKSTVASNLALAMRSRDARILIVDADFPRPVQHQVFGVPRQPGLSDVLVGEASLAEAVTFDSTSGIHILPAGNPVPHAADLLGGEEFRTLMARLSSDYDAVVVDTAPVLVIADAPAVASAVDGVIMVVRAQATERPALEEAAGRLRHVGAPLLGVVLNDVAPSGAYGRYYGAYNRRAYEEYVADEGKTATGPISRLRSWIRD